MEGTRERAGNTEAPLPVGPKQTPGPVESSWPTPAAGSPAKGGTLERRGSVAKSGFQAHPLWPRLREYFRVEVYDRDGSARRPRIRIEVNTPRGALLGEALAATMPCVACGKSIHPIRLRETGGRGHSGHLYYAACCPLEVRVGCSRGAAAREEYERFRFLIPAPKAASEGLFGQG